MDQSMKIVVNMLAKEKVGQTNLLYTLNKPWEEKLFLGIDFCSKDIIVNQKVYKVQVWRNNSSNYWVKKYSENKPDIIYCLIFDITNRDSFTYINKVADTINKTNKNLIYLLGNKADLESQRDVSIEEAESFANNHNMKYYEVSAKTKQPKSLEEVLTIALSNMIGVKEALKVED